MGFWLVKPSGKKTTAKKKVSRDELNEEIGDEEYEEDDTFGNEEEEFDVLNAPKRGKTQNN